jgi:hypothetical protein
VSTKRDGSNAYKQHIAIFRTKMVRRSKQRAIETRIGALKPNILL